MKLLLVEDNVRLAEDICRYLVESSFVVEQTATLREASERLAIYEYDLVIVDLGLPDGSGLELIRSIKDKALDIGILILTAKDALSHKISGLNMGADDYMTKPFHKAELNARIRSILRRNKFNRSNVIQFAEIKVDLLAAEVSVQDRAVDLTRKEYDLLIYFLQNPNRVLTKESIAEHLWGDHIDEADRFDFIYNHIKNLRKKIVNAGGSNYIKAMYGMGYKWTSARN